MKTVPVEFTGQTLRTLLPMIAEEEAVFLTVKGQFRFVAFPPTKGTRKWWRCVATSD